MSNIFWPSAFWWNLVTLAWSTSLITPAKKSWPNSFWLMSTKKFNQSKSSENIFIMLEFKVFYLYDCCCSLEQQGFLKTIQNLRITWKSPFDRNFFHSALLKKYFATKNIAIGSLMTKYFATKNIAIGTLMTKYLLRKLSQLVPYWQNILLRKISQFVP